ncbi:MAG: hypothetical protein ABIP53_04255 [Candidatus Limnocylindrales bacterium]
MPTIEAGVRRFSVGVGLEIRDARIARRVTAAQLAERAGVSRSLVIW